MKFYLDTNIWIDYLNKKRTNHSNAIKLFNKIKRKNHLILITELHIYETKITGYYNSFEKIKNELWKQGLCKGIKIKKENRIKAINLNNKKDLGVADYLHLLTALKEKAIPISNDKHWKKISKIINYNSYSYKEILTD